MQPSRHKSIEVRYLRTLLTINLTSMLHGLFNNQAPPCVLLKFGYLQYNYLNVESQIQNLEQLHCKILFCYNIINFQQINQLPIKYQFNDQLVKFQQVNPSANQSKHFLKNILLTILNEITKVNSINHTDSPNKNEPH